MSSAKRMDGRVIIVMSLRGGCISRRSNLPINLGIVSSQQTLLAMTCCNLRIQMFRKEIGDRVITGDAILVLENIMTFIFEDQQFHILAFGF